MCTMMTSSPPAPIYLSSKPPTLTPSSYLTAIYPTNSTILETSSRHKELEMCANLTETTSDEI